MTSNIVIITSTVVYILTRCLEIMTSNAFVVVAGIGVTVAVAAAHPATAKAKNTENKGVAMANKQLRWLTGMSSKQTIVSFARNNRAFIVKYVHQFVLSSTAYAETFSHLTILK